MLKESTIASMDKLVHDLVMGGGEFDPNFSPSTNIEDAMKVEQRLFELGYQVLTRRCMGNRCGMINSGQATYGQFFCNVTKEKGEDYFANRTHYKSVADTLPMAICMSAVKAGVLDIE